MAAICAWFNLARKLNYYKCVKIKQYAVITLKNNPSTAISD